MPATITIVAIPQLVVGVIVRSAADCCGDMALGTVPIIPSSLASYPSIAVRQEGKRCPIAPNTLMNEVPDATMSRTCAIPAKASSCFSLIVSHQTHCCSAARFPAGGRDTYANMARNGKRRCDGMVHALLERNAPQLMGELRAWRVGGMACYTMGCHGGLTTKLDTTPYILSPYQLHAVYG